MPRQSPPVLELETVSKNYGSLVAVAEVTLRINEGSRYALIGPNGAGKTTLFDLIAGTVEVSTGTIRFHGRDVTSMKEHKRARLGMGRTLQHSSLFDGLSNLENVSLAVQRHKGTSGRIFAGDRSARLSIERARELLGAVGLDRLAGKRAGEISHGERRQLEVAMALAVEPSLLLLDEPTAGMSKAESEQFLNLLATLAGSLTLLIVEHDMDVVFSIASRVAVLDAGRLLAEGTPEEVRSSVAVQEAYLGKARMEELFRPA